MESTVRDDLLLYYERELTFLRQMGAEFAGKYPKIASRLILEPDKCEDPHVERMLEAFAFLAARVHLKIDDEFPEITEALLSILYPHYMRPIPSMSVAEFYVDPAQVKPDTGLKLDRGSMLRSRPVNGVPCKFRTCYDITFWPLSVAEAEWTTPDRLKPPLKSSEAVAAVRVELRCADDVDFPQTRALFAALLSQRGKRIVHIALRTAVRTTACRSWCATPRRNRASSRSGFRPSALRPVGFAEDEGMLPYPRRSFLGYRLLQEYSAFRRSFSSST